MYRATLAYQQEASLGEGAIWNHINNQLYWVDIEDKKLFLYDPTQQKEEFIELPSRIGTVVIINKDSVLVALEDGIHLLNTKNKDLSMFTSLSDQLIESRLNDGKCDPEGRLWVGSMHLKQLSNKANLYTVNSDGSWGKKLNDVTISNGIVWSSDKSTMFYIDTPTLKVMAYNFDATSGEITSPRVAVSIPEELGYPDGMTIDEEDMLWIALWNGNAVIRCNPKTGEIITKIDVPAHNVTSCAFGGPDLDTLYITSARIDMTNEELQEYPQSGALFKVVPGVKGVKSNLFKLKP